MTWDKWASEDAWQYILCDVGSFESEAEIWAEKPIELTSDEWDSVRKDLNNRLDKLADEVLDNVVHLYLKGHYSN